jgi:hypothetical protein
VLLASKYLDEPSVSNLQWAKIGDLTVREMNELELEMLWKLKFELHVTSKEYDAYCQYCHKSTARMAHFANEREDAKIDLLRGIGQDMVMRMRTRGPSPTTKPLLSSSANSSTNSDVQRKVGKDITSVPSFNNVADASTSFR